MKPDVILIQDIAQTHATVYKGADFKELHHEKAYRITGFRDIYDPTPRNAHYCSPFQEIPRTSK